MNDKIGEFLPVRLLVVILVLTVIFSASGCRLAAVRQTPPPVDYYSMVHIPTLKEARRPSGDDLDKMKPEERDTVEIFYRYNRAVVNITTLTLNPLWLFGPAPYQGTGSGVLIDSSGLLLTNFHVVKNAEQLVVTLFDGTNYEAKLIGMDPENDLALIRFAAPSYLTQTIPFGSSADLYVGQKVIALGNPFGLQRTLTTGVISGLERPIRTQDGFIIRDLIQTDATINPGNSGGPLLNTRGELIGINTMILTPTGGSIGIGFAVPVDTVTRVLPELIEHGKVIRGWIDIYPVPLYPRLARHLRAPTDWGILISEVRSGSPAAQAGLRGGSREQWVRVGSMRVYLGGDIILSIDGKPVPTFDEYLEALERKKPGETVTVEVLRGSRRLAFQVALSGRPREFPW